MSALVVVALVTTMMAAPMLSFRDRRRGVVPDVDREKAGSGVQGPGSAARGNAADPARTPG
ncbi:hypothetical protein, partial [Crossiella equi]